MKEFFLLITLFSCIGMLDSAPREYFEAVEQSEAMRMIKAEGNVVTDIFHVATFNCPGCHQFAVLYKNAAQDEVEKTATFYTRITHFGDTRILVYRRDPKVRKT